MTDLAGVWIVIPAYNEARLGTIGTTVRDVRRAVPNVVVVDDCSRDETAELALAAGAIVCRHLVNLGQGAALATGIAFALGRGATEIVTFDADGQHRVEDAIAMVATLREHAVDVVLGSRFKGSAVGMTRGRRLLLKVAVLFTRIATGLTISDAHNGLRVLSRSAAERIRIRQNRMAHASEILSEIAAQGLVYVEAPVQVLYTDYSRAKGQRMSGAFDILSDLFVRRFYE